VKLLLIAPVVPDVSGIDSFEKVWSHFLSWGLRRRGIELRYAEAFDTSALPKAEIIRYYRQFDLSDIDHIVSLGTVGLRYFERVPSQVGELLMQRCRGVVVQIHDYARLKASPCHCTFTITKNNVNDKTPKQNRLIGWGADPNLLEPDQDPSELRILVDHPGYGSPKWFFDMSVAVQRDCLDFADSGLWGSRYRSIRLRRHVDGGFEDFTAPSVAPYRHIGCPWPVLAAEYRKTHVFMMTHREMIGISAIEAAMAGALVVVPRAGPTGPRRLFVPQDRLDTIRHIVYGHSVPWQIVLDNIHVARSRRQAIEHNWDAVAGNVIRALKATAAAEGRPFC